MLRRIRNRKQVENDGQVIAGLSFGFWVAMLQPRYNPAVWSAQLRSTFPSFPKEKGRKTLAQKVSNVVWLRNRIWHHEPIIKLDLSARHSEVLELLGWLSPEKAAWIRPYCRVPLLLREKP